MTTTTTIQLVVLSEGLLAFPTGDWEDATQPSMLLCRYDAGDVDVPTWPAPDADMLARALFDERECNAAWPKGEVQILLPDGTPFAFE